MSRRRGLTPGDRDLWGRVARSVDPLTRRPAPTPPSPLPPPLRAGPPALHPLLPAFRVGERSQTAGRAHDLAPTMAEAYARAPLAMDGGTHRRMRRGKLAPEARIDLHGMTLADAEPSLTAFLRASHRAGRRLVLVITGKGRTGDVGGDWTQPRPGALKRQVPIWLHRAPLAAIVQQATPAHRRHGGEGALYVYLRRPR